MSALLALLAREPVRALVVVAGVVPIVTDGLVIFGTWSPTVEQLAFVNGAPVALGAALGWQVVRNRVTPVE